MLASASGPGKVLMAKWMGRTSRGPAMPLQINNPGDFGVALLQRLGAPVTKSNLQFLIAWSNEEGGNWHNAAHFNPLNTTLMQPGAVSMNSVGVKAYTSWDQGIGATVATLHNGRYDDIVAALQGGNAAQTAVSAAGLRTWSGGGYGTIMQTIPGASSAADQALANAGTIGSGGTVPVAPPSQPTLQFGTEPLETVADPVDLSDLARILDQRADVVATLADGLNKQLAAATWSGPAADAFRSDTGELVPTMSHDADTLRWQASDLRRLGNQLQQELDRLRVVEAKVRAWLAAHPPGSGLPAPWPANDLPPTGDPRWRDVEHAFAPLGVI
jgi:uncharacterized protein YukE